MIVDFTPFMCFHTNCLFAQAVGSKVDLVNRHERGGHLGCKFPCKGCLLWQFVQPGNLVTKQFRENFSLYYQYFVNVFNRPKNWSPTTEGENTAVTDEILESNVHDFVNTGRKLKKIKLTEGVLFSTFLF